MDPELRDAFDQLRQQLREDIQASAQETRAYAETIVTAAATELRQHVETTVAASAPRTA